MAAAGLKKKKFKRMFKQPAGGLTVNQRHNIEELREPYKLGEQATNLMEQGHNLQTIEDTVPGTLEKLGSLHKRYMEAAWLLMGINEAELKKQFIEVGILFPEESEKYPDCKETRHFKAGTSLGLPPLIEAYCRMSQLTKIRPSILTYILVTPLQMAVVVCLSAAAGQFISCRSERSLAIANPFLDDPT